MSFHLATVALAFLAFLGLPSAADLIDIGSVTQATLVFEDDFDPARRVPHVLKVFLRVRNTHDSAVSWVANSVRDIEAELRGPNGVPAPSPDEMVVVSIGSSDGEFVIPYGSRLDWLISHGGISFTDSKDLNGQLAVMVGGKVWLVPLDNANSYALQVRVHGNPWGRSGDAPRPDNVELLFDVPPTNIKLAR